MEEDEDLHNKMKYDHMISDEQITADNAKISTLETNISAKSASVAQLTDEIDMLENDSKQVQVLASRANKAQQRTLTTTQSDVLIAPRNNRTMKVSCEYVPQYVSQSGEALGVLKQLVEEMSSDIVATEDAELEHKKTVDDLSDKE